MFIHSLSWCINRLFKVLTLSSINYYAWKNIEFYFAQYYAYGNDSSHTAERTCWKWFFLTLNHFYSFYQQLDAWWYFFGLCFVALVSLSTQSSACYWAIKDLMCPSIICSKCITHLWIFLLLPPGHPSISHLCTFPWSPAKNQVTSYFLPLMPPICANKLGHAILSNSISR